ncbi:unnamed protein product [Amoebophrya sp. A120]|nr:unnamed protein product [Amoebophrya sp. A120]|eukprot:GSA120T00015572001.1
MSDPLYGWPQPPIVIAARDGNLQKIRALLDSDPDAANAFRYRPGMVRTDHSCFVKEGTYKDLSPLIAAADAGHVDIVFELLSAGAWVHFKYSPDDSLEFQDEDDDTGVDVEEVVRLKFNLKLTKQEHANYRAIERMVAVAARYCQKPCLGGGRVRLSQPQKLEAADFTVGELRKILQDDWKATRCVERRTRLELDESMCADLEDTSSADSEENLPVRRKLTPKVNKVLKKLHAEQMQEWKILLGVLRVHKKNSPKKKKALNELRQARRTVSSDHPADPSSESEMELLRCPESLQGAREANKARKLNNGARLDVGVPRGDENYCPEMSTKSCYLNEENLRALDDAYRENASKNNETALPAARNPSRQPGPLPSANQHTPAPIVRAEPALESKSMAKGKKPQEKVMPAAVDYSGHPLYPFPCPHCIWWFVSQEALNMHSRQSILCPGSQFNMKRRAAAAATAGTGATACSKK